MKVVINTVYGGFGLSVEAIKYLHQKKSELVKEYEPWDGVEWFDIGEGYFGSRRFDFIKKDEIVYTVHDRERDHPDLVELVETMGEKANGLFAYLKVVEIPDGIEYTISDYDGIEAVHEKHRIWK